MIKSKLQLRPRSVLAIESLKIGPFCSMFGWVETESVAEKIVQWLSENGNRWHIKLPDLSQFGSEWELDHSHLDPPGPSRGHEFAKDFMEDGAVNGRFISCVTRSNDHRELTLDNIRKLVAIDEDVDHE